MKVRQTISVQLNFHRFRLENLADTGMFIMYIIRLQKCFLFFLSGATPFSDFFFFLQDIVAINF